jgi:hypothetical protein
VTALEPVDSHDDDEEDVDVDLDAIDEDIRREAVGEPTTVKIAGKVIHIDHAGNWSTTALRAASFADWDTWAREVIAADDEYAIWESANLRVYQVEAVFEKCGNMAMLSPGKSQKRTGPSRTSRRR